MVGKPMFMGWLPEKSLPGFQEGLGVLGDFGQWSGPHRGDHRHIVFATDTSGAQIVVAAGQISEGLSVGQLLDFFFGRDVGIGGDREGIGPVLRPVSDIPFRKLLHGLEITE